VDGPLECLRVLNYAEKNRAVAFTNINAHSSRSHSMLMVRIEKQLKSMCSSSHSTNDKSSGGSRANNILNKIQLNSSHSNVTLNQ
jgi:hypothetical protein